MKILERLQELLVLDGAMGEEVAEVAAGREGPVAVDVALVVAVEAASLAGVVERVVAWLWAVIRAAHLFRRPLRCTRCRYLASTPESVHSCRVPTAQLDRLARCFVHSLHP